MVLRRVRFAICLLVAPVLVATGCGSSNSASTSTTTLSQQASAPSGAAAQTAAQGTTGGRGATGSQTAGQGTSSPAQHTTATSAPEAKPEPVRSALPKTLSKAQEEKAREIVAKAKKEVAGFTRGVPVARRYPPEVYKPFLAACQAGQGSRTSCECIVRKQELLSNVERDLTIAELLAMQLALQKGTPLPRIVRHATLLPPHVQQSADQCKNA